MSVNSQTEPLTEADLTESSDKKSFLEKLKMPIFRVLLVIVLLSLWQFSAGRFFDIFWTSAPNLILSKLWEWITSGELFFHLAITAQEMFAGFTIGAILGMFVGFLLGRWSFGAALLEPFIIALYSLPKLALAPLFILWFGIGMEMKIVYAAMIVFFLVFFNTFAGVRDVDEDLLDNIRLMGASEKQILTKVIIPSALNWVFVGLKLSVPYALVGAVVGEIMASNKGIGYLLAASAANFDTTGTFAAVFVLLIVAVTLNAVLIKIESRLLRWKKTNTQ